MNYDLDGTASSVAAADLNGDGWLDLAVANLGSDSVSILLANGAGTFAPPVNFGAGDGPSSIAVGDFDRNGKYDLAVVNSSGNNVSILLGNGAGSFATAVNYGAGTNPKFVAVGDFNADGKADLAVANRASWDVSVLIGSGTGTFTVTGPYVVASANPEALVIGEFSGDGLPDIAVANYGYSNVSILRNNGAGFDVATIYAVATPPHAITAGDFNGDGRLDLAVTGGDFGNPASVSILRATVARTFAPAANFNLETGSVPFSVKVADYNGDGKQDLAAANSQHSDVSILLDMGLCAARCTGTFGSPDSYSVAVRAPQSVATGDLNGDGKTDVVSANLSNNDEGTITVFFGTGDGRLTISGVYAVQSTGGGTFATNSVAIADFNRDGKPDVAAGNGGPTNDVAIFLNTGNGTFPTNPSLPPRYPAGTGVRSVAAADLDRDGDVDLVVTNEAGHAVSILLGNGSGAFAAPSTIPVGTYPRHTAIGDFNRDGIPDLAVANSGSLAAPAETVSILLGNGNGGFTAAANVQTGAGSFPRAVAIGDLNRDGKLDLAVAEDDTTGDIAIRLGNGDGTFTTPASPDDRFSGGSGYWTDLQDFNGDGKLDIVATTGLSDFIVASGLGNGTFAGGKGYAVNLTFPHLVVADMNSDGKPDIITTHPAAAGVSVVLNGCAADLVVAKTHSGNFTQGDTGKTYNISVSNAGAVSTPAGSVFVNEYMPSGLKPVSISGSGWTCDVPSRFCSRSGTLGGLATFPPITVTVDVRSNAGPVELNAAEVAGSGDSNRANSRAEDPTTIDPSTGLIGATSVDAFAISPTDVHVDWDAVTGATGYQVRRTFNRGLEEIFLSATPGFTNSGLTPGTAYIYYVTAVAGSTVGASSRIDFATTVFFDNLVGGQTPITAKRTNDVRAAITALRASAPGVPAVSFVETITPGVVVKASHYTEMLTRLNEALTALGFSQITFAPPAPATGVVVQSTHIRQLQRPVE